MVDDIKDIWTITELITKWQIELHWRLCIFIEHTIYEYCTKWTPKKNIQWNSICHLVNYKSRTWTTILYHFTPSIYSASCSIPWHRFAGPPDGHLPDPADQDSAATAREAHVRFGESAQGIPEAPPRVVAEQTEVNKNRERKRREETEKRRGGTKLRNCRIFRERTEIKETCPLFRPLSLAAEKAPFWL